MKNKIKLIGIIALVIIIVVASCSRYFYVDIRNLSSYVVEVFGGVDSLFSFGGKDAPISIPSGKTRSFSMEAEASRNQSYWVYVNFRRAGEESYQDRSFGTFTSRTITIIDADFPE